MIRVRGRNTTNPIIERTADAPLRAHARERRRRNLERTIRLEQNRPAFCVSTGGETRAKRNDAFMNRGLWREREAKKNPVGYRAPQRLAQHLTVIKVDDTARQVVDPLLCGTELFGERHEERDVRLVPSLVKTGLELGLGAPREIRHRGQEGVEQGRERVERRIDLLAPGMTALDRAFRADIRDSPNVVEMTAIQVNRMAERTVLSRSGAISAQLREQGTELMADRGGQQAAQ